MAATLRALLARARDRASPFSSADLERLVGVGPENISVACVLGHSGRLSGWVKDRIGSTSGGRARRVCLERVCASPLCLHSWRHVSALLSSATLLLECDVTPAGHDDWPMWSSALPVVAMEAGNAPLALHLHEKGVKVNSENGIAFLTRLQNRVPQPLAQALVRHGHASSSVSVNWSSHTSIRPMALASLQLPNRLGSAAALWATVSRRPYMASGVFPSRLSLLHVLAEYAPASLFSEYFAQGGSADGKDENGRSVFTAAIRAGNWEVGEVLRRHGASDDAGWIDRVVGLCRTEDVVAVEAMLGAGRLNSKTLSSADMTPLFESASAGRAGPTDLLITAGFPVNGRDPSGATALHGAAWHGNVDIVRLLLSRGADPCCADSILGQTPIDWALDGMSHAASADGNHGDTIELLASWMA